MTDQTMTKTPPYTVIRLGMEHLDQLMDLQDRVLGTLPSDQNLIFKKTRSDFTHYLAHDHHYMLGVIRSDGVLVEKSAVIVPHDKEPDPHIADLKRHDSFDKLCNLEGSMVDPSARGQGLMIKVAHTLMDQMPDIGRHHFVATIERSNAPCWIPFLKEGVHIADVTVDPADNAEIWLIHKDVRQKTECECLHLRGDFSKAAKAGTPVEIITPQTPFAKLKDLFNQGYVGVSPERDAANKYTGNIVFVPETAIVCSGQPKLCAP